MTRLRLFPAALLIAAVAVAAAPAQLSARAATAAETHSVATRASAISERVQQPEASPEKQATGKDHESAARHDSWEPAIAKFVNFAILVGILVYFLRTPLMGYLAGRIGRVREDLIAAAQTRETAQRQLAYVRAKVQALPAEIEALKHRGAEDIVAERARIEHDAEVERRRLLEHTRREIETRLRLAKRELLELTADLAVRAASDRIRASITAADQVRLVDRYTAQLERVQS
jgi:F-type H+-transporting ATPase subunit b